MPDGVIMGFVQGGVAVRDIDDLVIRGIKPKGLITKGEVIWRRRELIWTSQQTPADIQWNSVTYGNGLFVAVASSGTNRVMTSPDGITWTQRFSALNFNGTTELPLLSVAYGNNIFVAVGWGTGYTETMSSPNGIAWTARSIPYPNYQDNSSVVYGNGRFVAVAWGSATGGTTLIISSTNGTTWSHATGNFSFPSYTDIWHTVTYGDGLFVTVGASGQLATSPDGINWTQQPNIANQYWRSVTYGNGLFVAVSSTGTTRIITSPDGIYWTPRPSRGDSLSLWSVTYGGGWFVATTTGNQVLISHDGINWRLRPAAGAAWAWSNITYGQDKFVAVANSGTGNRVMTAEEPNHIL